MERRHAPARSEFRTGPESPTGGHRLRQFDYEHDDLGRLRRAKLLGIILGAPALHDQSFTYSSTDDWNIASITDNLGVEPTKTFAYDDHDRITAQTPGAPPTYDPVGNITNDGQRAMTWDLRGRLTTMDLNGTAAPPVAFNSYDPFGRLIAQKIGFAPAAFHLWDGWTQVGEFVSGSGASGGAGTFRLAPGPVGMLGHRNMPSGAFVEYGFDHQQSRVSQTEGAPIYDAFGGIIDGGAALDSPIGFQGQEWRAESSLYYMRHRWYDPESARFMSRDPVIGARLSNYDFVMGSPVELSDPMGEDHTVIVSTFPAGGGYYKAHLYLDATPADVRGNRAHHPVSFDMAVTADNATARDTRSNGFYGEYQNTPPGWFNLTPHSGKRVAYGLALNEPGTPGHPGEVNGRTGLLWHAGGPQNSQGCATTAKATYLELRRNFIDPEIASSEPVWLYVPFLNGDIGDEQVRKAVNSWLYARGPR